MAEEKRNSYVSIDGRTFAEVDVNKSRFIAVAFHVESVEDVKQCLATLKKSNPKAAHIPFAYMIGAGYDTGKNSDDGEPAGSAGFPIYEAIKKHTLTNTLVAVVRYFGGTELGKSKLTRTFGFVANEALRMAQKFKMIYCNIFDMNVSYTNYANLGKILTEKNLPIIEKDYNESKPRIKFAVPVDASAKFLEEIRAKIRETSTYSKVGNDYFKFMVE